MLGGFLGCPPRSTRYRIYNVFPGRWGCPASIRQPMQTAMFEPLERLIRDPSTAIRYLP
jgi:hypothetical protein